MTTATSPDSKGKLRIAVAGATGRMGRMLIEAIHASDDCVLSGACDIEGSPAIGSDAMAYLGLSSGVRITADVDAALENSDCLIDFTRPEGTIAHAASCERLGVHMVIGTTGFSADQKDQLQRIAQSIGIVLAPNMSVGVNVTLKLLQMAAQTLNAGYDVEIIEAHHRHKVDAPSGTALKMGEVIASAQGKTLADCAVYTREGHTGERSEGSIGFATIRGGDIVGDHTVLFAGIGERIEITHKSSSRETYAQGSLRAARFLSKHGNGLYDMFDVLNLR